MINLATIVSDDDTFILLRYVESIKENNEPQETVVDKLKGDISLIVTTTSGKVYTISMLHQIETYKDHDVPQNIYEMRNSILEQWIRISNE